MAAVLDVPVENFGLTVLDDMPTAETRDGHFGPRNVVPIAAAQEDSLQRRELLSGLVGLAGLSALSQGSNREVPRVTDARQYLSVRLRQVRADFDACRYRDVALDVPEIVAVGHRLLADAVPGRQREQLSAVLADAYCLASFLADKLGDYGLAWVMADRARAHAQLSGDSTSLAISIREAAVAMRRAGYLDDAARLLTTTADSIPAAAPADMAARGCLLLTAAYTHAQNGQGSEAMDLITDARNVTRHLPVRWPSNAICTSTQVSVYAVGVHNALGNHGQALAAARTISLAALPTVERRVKACLDVARAHLGCGKAANGLNVLRTVERLAPEDARRPSVRLLLRQLLEIRGAHPSGLVAFARRNGAI